MFPSSVGTPLSHRNVVRSFKAVLRRADLPSSVRLYDLRHTCATLLLSRNVHPKYVQELLGHASIAQTLDTYSHVLPGMGVRPPVRWTTLWVPDGSRSSTSHGTKRPPVTFKISVSEDGAPNRTG